MASHARSSHARDDHARGSHARDIASHATADPIPAGFENVIAYLTVRGAAEALNFYERAFGAVVKRCAYTPDGRVVHAEFEVGGSLVFIGDEFPEMNDGKETSPSGLGGTTVTLHRFVTDCDASFARAVEAGAEPLMEPAEMFWGDRFAKVRDPFGHEWSIATHLRDVTVQEESVGAAAFFRDR